MKRFVAVLLFWAAASSAVYANPPAPYTIAAGDVLEINVWKNQDLTRQQLVFPDGSIQYPLIGEIPVAGLTVSMLAADLKAKLVDFVHEPEVTVSVSQANSMMVYVLGKVTKPGGFRIHTRVDVLQALCLAGGLTPFAREKEIRIFRKTGGDTRILNFNYQAVADGKDLEQNILLQRGDVVVVR